MHTIFAFIVRPTTALASCSGEAEDTFLISFKKGRRAGADAQSVMMDTYQGDLKYIYRKSMRNLSGVRLKTENVSSSSSSARKGLSVVSTSSRRASCLWRALKLKTDSKWNQCQGAVLKRQNIACQKPTWGGGGGGGAVRSLPLSEPTWGGGGEGGGGESEMMMIVILYYARMKN